MKLTLKDYKQEVLIARDKISGFKGKVTAHADYITGCDQYLLQPDSKEGDWKDAKWFDEARLEITEMVPNLNINSLVGAENGSDQEAPIK